MGGMDLLQDVRSVALPPVPPVHPQQLGGLIQPPM